MWHGAPRQAARWHEDRQHAEGGARLPIADFEDAVQAETAREAGCSLIVTRNLRGYATSPIPAIDPASYIAQHGSDGGGDVTSHGR